MLRIFLAAGVAAMALSAPAASAQPDKRGDRQTAQKSERQKAQKARSAKRQTARSERAVRSGGQRTARAERPARVERSERRAQRVAAMQPREQRAERRQRVERVNRVAERVDRQARVADRRDQRLERIATRDDRRIVQRAERQDRLRTLARQDVVPLREWDELVRGGVWVNGCPPGLAKKPVACVPPGQVKNVVGQPLSVLSNRVALQTLPDRLRLAYQDTPDYYYRYGNGYVYRVDRDDDIITSLLPLFGLGLTTGQMFPTAYSNSYLPAGLTPFYPSYSSNDYYRYANGYVYEIDGRTGLIEDVDPMLGYGYGYGQMMPLTYSAYNVPYQYRPLYFDTSDSYYRYAPGAIYQVDPTTSLITAVSALLTGGMTVGQPMPLGYSAYNVPYQYRTTYIDTPNDWYRYSNGYVYRVDPATQLVTAIVASALT